MKKKIIALIAGMMISAACIGCGGNKEIKIGEWMFAGDLTWYDCERNLSGSEEKEGSNYKLLTWEDYELVEGYKGTLSCNFFTDPINLNGEELLQFTWSWRLPCSENEKDDILKIFEKKYEDNKVLDIGLEEDRRTIYTFDTKYKYDGIFKSENDENYCIDITYEKDLLSVSWGNGQYIYRPPFD